MKCFQINFSGDNQSSLSWLIPAAKNSNEYRQDSGKKLHNLSLRRNPEKACSHNFKKSNIKRYEEKYDELKSIQRERKSIRLYLNCKVNLDSSQMWKLQLHSPS